MAFDGITIANIVQELNQTVLNGRLYKIAQPEKDELLLTIKNNGGQYRLLLSASASLPLVYLTDANKPSPMTAPNFCMVLRKHLQNGKILRIYQPDMERIIHFEIEHLDEMGDLCRKQLIVELMGKHSNIIFCNEDLTIIDSIKHISAAVSSVREVLPGKPYFVADRQHKENPMNVDAALFDALVFTKEMDCFKAIYTSFTGLSPVFANEICHKAGVAPETLATNLSAEEKERISALFFRQLKVLKNNSFAPVILYDHGVPIEYASFPLTCYPCDGQKDFSSISELLEQFYAERSMVTRIRQKSVDLRKIVQTALDRNNKKYELQMQQMKDTEKKDTFRIYGELLNTYGYQVEPGSKSMEALNYYTNETIKIPLDNTLSAIENAKKYFDKYGKLKRTFEALSALTLEVKSEIDHLESISNSLDIAQKEEDLLEIKEELTESGYIRRKGKGKKEKVTSKPFHYLSSDGFHIYIGKNNYQNEELTFKFATGNDWWFHAKGIPGSHVIVKSAGSPLPDRVFEEAGRLAAHYSKGRGQSRVEIDYTERKNVKKPSGGKPGFVIYYTNYSLQIDSDISGLKQLD